MKFIKYISIILSLFSLTNLNALIIGAEMYARENGDSFNFLIPLSDGHFVQKENDQNFRQKQEFFAEIKKLQETYGTDSVLVVTEDMLHVSEEVYCDNNFRDRINQAGKMVVDFENQTRCLFLFGITHICHNKIHVKNVEFRHCTPLYWQLEQEAQTKNSNPIEILKTSLEKFVDTYQLTRKIILTYYDGYKLNRHYQKAISSFDQLLNDLHRLDTNVLENLRNIHKAYQTCFSEFINFKILHQISLNPHKKFIFICAGGSHTREISKFYDQLGYRKIDTSADPINKHNEDLSDDKPKTMNDLVKILQVIQPLDIGKFFGVINFYAENLSWHKPSNRHCQLKTVMCTEIWDCGEGQYVRYHESIDPYTQPHYRSANSAAAQ